MIWDLKRVTISWVKREKQEGISIVLTQKSNYSVLFRAGIRVQIGLKI